MIQQRKIKLSLLSKLLNIVSHCLGRLIILFVKRKKINSFDNCFERGADEKKPIPGKMSGRSQVAVTDGAV